MLLNRVLQFSIVELLTPSESPVCQRRQRRHRVFDGEMRIPLRRPRIAVSGDLPDKRIAVPRFLHIGDGLVPKIIGSRSVDLGSVAGIVPYLANI